jgi:transposase
MSKKLKDLEFLVNKLHKRGFDNEKIAKELDISVRTYYRWTSREIRTPKIALMALTLLLQAE